MPCKCSSEHVESRFDKLAKSFPVKIQLFLAKVQKRRKTNCSRVIFWSFSSVHLDFDRPDDFFCQIQKKFTQSLEKHDTTINYFITFSQSLAEDTWNALSVNLLNIFAKSWILSLRDWTRSNNYITLQKSLQTFRWTRRLSFW